MKKYFKSFVIIIFMIFSFYYTEKIAVIAQNNTPLKKEIVTFKEDNIISSINAKIDGNEITPGLNGLVVNVEKSYINMKSQNVFNLNSLVYDEVKPIISINDYPEKIITQGNIQRKAVSIIINFTNKNIDYLKNNNIKYTYFNNPNYCIILSESDCFSYKRRVKPTYLFNNTNFIKHISDVKNGSIIYLDDNLDEMFIDILVKHIKFYNLKVLPLEEHLSENNSI